MLAAVVKYISLSLIILLGILYWWYSFPRRWKDLHIGSTFKEIDLATKSDKALDSGKAQYIAYSGNGIETKLGTTSRLLITMDTTFLKNIDLGSMSVEQRHEFVLENMRIIAMRIENERLPNKILKRVISLF